jgi:hypothetical protein
LLFVKQRSDFLETVLPGLFEDVLWDRGCGLGMRELSCNVGKKYGTGWRRPLVEGALDVVGRLHGLSDRQI